MGWKPVCDHPRDHNDQHPNQAEQGYVKHQWGEGEHTGPERHDGQQFHVAGTHLPDRIEEEPGTKDKNCRSQVANPGDFIPIQRCDHDENSEERDHEDIWYAVRNEIDHGRRDHDSDECKPHNGQH